MGADNRCRQCGSALADRVMAALCPICLLRAGINEGDPDASATRGPSSTGVFTSLIEVIGEPPRVLLRDTELVSGPGALVLPSSPEMPAAGEGPGRLQLLGEIARGGMGAVLKGRDPDIGRDVAVKVLLETHRDKPELIRRFIEEAQIGGQLQHPGIVPIYDLGTLADHRPYFAMKLVKRAHAVEPAGRPFRPITRPAALPVDL